ncbi:MAG: hypothetical protein LBM99_05975 [Bacillales bacterium]|jgi:hypothetical protein|nr:hypothetical protein [Bacillales bacterium]
MKKNMFRLLLPMISADIIANIIKKKKCSEDKVILLFLKSQTYQFLSNEKTKMWHLSNYEILKVYENEIKGSFIVPEIF